MPRDNEEDHAVGYGKPPKRTQFKPGQSGNPRGRPKGRKSLSALFGAELRTSVNVTEDGKTKRMTKDKAIAKRVVNAVLKGDSKAFALFVRLHAPNDETPESASERPLTAKERQLLDDFIDGKSGRRRR